MKQLSYVKTAANYLKISTNPNYKTEASLRRWLHCHAGNGMAIPMR